MRRIRVPFCVCGGERKTAEGRSPQKGGGIEIETLVHGPGAEAPRAEEGGDEVAPIYPLMG